VRASVTWRVARSGESVVVVEGDPAQLAALAERLSPYITLSRDARGSEMCAFVRVADVPPEGAGWQRFEFPSQYEPVRSVYANAAERRLVVAGPDDAWRALQAVRTIRNALRWDASNKGAVFLHGGLVQFGNIGVAILGPRRAGKTSLVLASMIRGAAMIANDDVTVEEYGSSFVGRGWPRSVNIRIDTLLALTEILPQIDALRHSSHPTNSWDGVHKHHPEWEPRGLPASVWVYPKELAATLSSSLVPAATVDSIVFPEFTGDSLVQLERLSPALAREYLLRNAHPVPVEYDTELYSWITREPRARAAASATLDRLSGEIPCFRLRQHMTTLLPAVETLAKLAAVGDD
jgi:hypothetical protein